MKTLLQHINYQPKSWTACASTENVFSFEGTRGLNIDRGLGLKCSKVS
jgi:hypothetical protein